MERTRPEATSQATLPTILLSSTLVAGFLNLAAGILGHPRALDGWVHLGLPLAAGCVALLGLALVFVLLPLIVGRRLGFARGPLAGALGAGFVLCAALAPMVEVALREASSQRAAVVLGCAAGFVLCAAACVHGLVARACLARFTQHAAVGLPLAAAILLTTLWAVEYRAESTALRAGAILAGAFALAAILRLAPRLDRAATLPVLAALVLVQGALDGFLGSRAHDSAVRHADARPPVVLITVDTLRVDRVLGEGPNRVPTPSIDRLAADSVVFTRARSAAPWTKPSLSTLLTGLSPLVHGMTNRRARLPEGVETLAERLRTAGYHTGGVGLNVHLERAFRLDQGFDDYAFPARPDYGIALGARVLEHLAPARFPEIYPSTTAIADVAVDWIDAHASEPFFLWVHVLDPHWPYEPPPEWVEHPGQEPRRWGDPTMVTNVQAGNTKPGEAERERVAELYAGEIRYVDSQLARVLDALRAHGLYEDALIVFASDHGEEFWEHGRYEHGHTLYDEVLRVPLFFKLPREEQRLRVDAAVSTEALVPTVLETLGLAFDPELLSSRSLAPWWRDPANARAEPLFAAGTYYYGEKQGVVFDDKKLVLELDTHRRELFDLGRDPAELHPVTAAQTATLEEGLRLLGDWQERCSRLRVRLGIESDVAATTDPAILEMMRGLGYN